MDNHRPRTIQHLMVSNRSSDQEAGKNMNVISVDVRGGNAALHINTVQVIY